MALSSPSEVRPIYQPFAQRITNELNMVAIDHSYAKPWSTHPEASNARTVRLLFMDALPRQSNLDKTSKDGSEMIDVEGEDKPSMPDYDISNARTMMSECERHAALLRPEFAEMKDDWEEHIAAIRTTWSVLQNRLFAKVMRVLQGDRLARLTIQETKNEPIQRRLQIDKAAKRVKFAFANVNWDMPLILWLHNLFLENLKGQLLTSYLEILQTLKLKIPSLIECLIEGTVCKPGVLSMDSLNILLKRTWDPVLSSIHTQKPKKLPGQSLLLVISNVHSMANSPLAAKRHKFWQHQLNFLGKVINIVPVNNSTSITVSSCVENMVASARSKILEVKGHFPGRPIVLVGFHIGSLVACQVAMMEQVHAVVCLGFHTMGVNGNRGEIEDPIYNCKTPTLFVVGQHASSCCVDDLEDVREKLRVDTGLVVVGGADDHLRMSRTRKKNCGVTQSVVDRCIIDEMANFLGNSLQSEVSSSDSMDDVDIIKKNPRKRKQKQTLAVAVGSQTSGDLVKQKPSKALKCLKQDPMLSSVSGALDGSQLVPGSIAHTLPTATPKVAKAGRRNSPKKQSKSLDSGAAFTKSVMQMNFKANSLKKSHGHSSLSTRNEAAVIASAPELSNLLQNMKTTDLTRLSSTQITSPSVTSVSTLPSLVTPASSTVQTNTALTLSKFLFSSSLFNSGPELYNSSEISPDGTDINKSSGNRTAPTLSAAEGFPKKCETQILIHTRDSAAPISFPVTFTMASKAPKTTASLTKPTGCGPATPSLSYSSVISTQPQAGILQVRPSPATIVSPSLQSALSSTKSSPSVIRGSSLPPPKSPMASIINIGSGSDSVQMKETPPSTTDPGTVSIDLGQLSASNNIVMKFGNPSKISLMPSLKPRSASSLLMCDKSDMTVAGLLTETKTAAPKTMASLTAPARSQKTSLPVYTSGKSSDKNLTILSSSDLLSSLSSSTATGLITLKLSSTPAVAVAAAHSSGLTVTPSAPKVSDRNEGGSETILKSLSEKPVKNITSMPFNPSMAGISTKLSKPVLSHHFHRDGKEEMVESKAMCTSTSRSLVLATTASPKTKSNTTASAAMTDPFVFQTTGSSSLYKTILVDNSETLGKVTSLLESSPVTVDQPRPMSTIANFISAAKDSYCPDKRPMTSSPPLSQGQTLTPRSSKSTISSYTPTTKQVLPTAASTRTRRIKTPKQYDL